MRRNRKTSKRAFIVEALAEYLIALLVQGAFLSMILKKMDISDATIGIVSSFISLTCCIQLFSNLIEKPGRKLRKTIIILTLINETLFAALYLIPLFPMPGPVKAAFFIIVILGAYFFLNISTPAKYRWLMMSVEDHQRGRFTAKKEMVSLIGGMLFSLGMGSIVDHYNRIGNSSVGFTLCCVCLFAVMAVHITMLYFVEDSTVVSTHRESKTREMLSFLKENKPLRRLLVIDILYRTATGISVPFYGTYLIGELGFSLTQVSVIGIVYSVTRCFASPLMGKYADKKGWSRLLSICFLIAASGFAVNFFAAPGTRYLYVAGHCLYAVAMAGLNSGIVNITFDYIDAEHFSAAMGMRNALGGVIGFLMTVLGSRVVSAIQANNNSLFGFPVYAQQVLSLLTCAIMIAAVFYTRTVIKKLPKLPK